VGDVEQVGHPAHQVVFMGADLLVGIGNLPQLFDDANPFGYSRLPIGEGGELLKIIGRRCCLVPPL